MIMCVGLNSRVLIQYIALYISLHFLYIKTVLLTSKSLCKAIFPVTFHTYACIHIEKDRQLTVALD